MDTCRVCGARCRNKGFTTIGGQKACSIHCAINIVPLENDRCSQCGAPVWINDNYKVNGLMCCSPVCKEECAERTGNLRTKKKVLQKQSDFLDPNPQTVSVFDGNNKYTNVNIGATNYAMGPRDVHTTDYDVGPGDKGGNLYHGDSNFAYNDYDDDFDEEDEAYGDYNERNYLREYGAHNYIQKNDGKSGDKMRELGMNIHEKKDKPKNEAREVVHHGGDIECEYCGFIIKDGSKAYVDNYGKKFDKYECFSNHFQGIPKPNFG